MADKPTQIILRGADDWEMWTWQLRNTINSAVWKYIDPDNTAVPPPEPEPPIPADFHVVAAQPAPPAGDPHTNRARNARNNRTPSTAHKVDIPTNITLATLSSDELMAYSEARRIYEFDVYRFDTRTEQLRFTRDTIQSTVDPSKGIHLDPSKSIREWIIALRDDTAPAEGEIKRQIRSQYKEHFRQFRPNKLLQWLDNWEALMLKGIHYDIPELHYGEWLQDLADRLRPVSEYLFYHLYAQSRDKQQRTPSTEFRKVAKMIRELLPTHGGRIVCGGAFAARFRSDDDEYIKDISGATGTTQEVKQAHAGPRGLKRIAGSGDTRESKKRSTSKSNTCPACGLKGHNLPACWAVFQERLPEGMTVPDRRVRKVEAAMEADDELRKQVETIRQGQDGT